MRDTLPKLPASERGRHVAINSSDLFALGVDDTSSLLESLQKTSEGTHWRVAEVLSEAPLGSYWGLTGVSLGARWRLAGGSLGARWGLAGGSLDIQGRRRRLQSRRCKIMRSYNQLATLK
jgi:hypothetical protein